MCGLLFVYSAESVLEIPECREALDLMHTRGPDGMGAITKEGGRLFFGHRRLSIQDLSESGSQPFQSQCGNITLIFNGEIYNHLALRQFISANTKTQITWRGHSDTETLVELISRFGFDEAIKTLRGMFAVCVYDRRKNEVLLARDRAGEKPLFFEVAQGRVIVSSTLDPIVYLSPKTVSAISPDALALYLQRNYVPDSLCIFDDVEKVLPGQKVVISLETLQATANLYWRLPVESERRVPYVQCSKDKEAHALRERIERSVEQQLISDRPIGTLLSGGIDSSVITAAAHHTSNNVVKTFSIGYDEKEYDESRYAEEIADHLGTEHTTFKLKPSDIIEGLTSIGRIYDEPFADYSQLPVYLLSERVVQHVTVALSGDGGDELFGGYNRHKYYKYWEAFRRLPNGVTLRANQLLAACSTDRLNKLLAPLGRIDAPGLKVQKFANAICEKTPVGYYHSTINHGIPKEAFVDHINADIWDPRTSSFPKDVSGLEKIMALDFCEYLPGDILTKVDRASMAASLECRAPFLDSDLVEYVASMPFDRKIRDGEAKAILKDVLATYLPRKLFERPKKGFGLPLDLWLRGDLKEFAYQNLFIEDRICSNGVVKSAYVKKIWEEHQRGNNKFSQIWCLIMANIWLRKNFG